MEISKSHLLILNVLKMIYLPSNLNIKILEIKVTFPFSVEFFFRVGGRETHTL